MKDAEVLRYALANFYGTEGYYFNPMYKWMIYTDGVKFFAENAGGGAYWLLDIIGTEFKELQKSERFVHTILWVKEGEADITASDGNGKHLYTRHLDYTDCPVGKWEFYLTDKVLMLTSEY